MSFYSLSATFGSPIVIGTQAISRNMLSSQNSQASQYSVPSRYAYNAPHKHISELMSCANVCTMSTFITIVKLLITHVLNVIKKQIITTAPPYKCSIENVTPDPQIKLVYYMLFL